MNGLYAPIATDEQSIANASFVHETAHFKDKPHRKPPFLHKTAHFKDKPHQLLRFIHEKGGFCGQQVKM
jgi:hypothetical protein